MLPEPLSLLKGWGRRRVHERRKTKSSDSRSRLAAPIGSPHPLLRPDKKPYSQRTPAQLPLFMLHTVLPTLWHRPWDCCLGGSSRMLALCCRFPVFAHSIPRRTGVVPCLLCQHQLESSDGDSQRHEAASSSRPGTWGPTLTWQDQGQ